MSEHRYILQPYNGIKTRHQCPECQQKDKSFTLYIDRETGEPLSDNTGRCEHVNKGGYHYTPKQYFADNEISLERKPYVRPIPKPHRPVSFIDTDVLKRSLTDYEVNDFVKFLHSLFDAETVGKLIARYFIATSKHKFKNPEFPAYIGKQGATVFWQIDKQGKVRTGKIMLYNPTTGKRVQVPFQHITFVHKTLKEPEFELKQCLFGEHLINSHPVKPIAIVESEKTAIIASVYLPELLWLSCGSLQNLTAERCKPLAGRNVMLYPDLSAFDKWNVKAKELRFTISDILERNATEADKAKGLDIADYLVRFNHKDFIVGNSAAKETETQGVENGKETSFDKTIKRENTAPETINNESMVTPEIKTIRLPAIIRPAKEFKQTWDTELNDLKTFFSTVNLPSGPYKLNEWSVCLDLKRYVQTNLSASIANNGNHTFMPYLERLQNLKSMLTDHK